MNEEFVKNSRDEVKILDVDFSNTQKAAEIVRDWAKKETNGALDLSGISFDPNTKLALTSTLYYKGKWIYEFPPAVPDFFTLENGRKVNVEMMNITKKYNYGKLGSKIILESSLISVFKNFVLQIMLNGEQSHMIQEKH
jgi:serpin B